MICDIVPVEGKPHTFQCINCERIHTRVFNLPFRVRCAKPPSPTMIDKMKNFAAAQLKWKHLGSKMRTKDQVKYIYDDICKPCQYFEDDSCKLCGCRLKRDEMSSFNKIAMATEGCPIKKWLAEVGVEEKKGCGGCKKAKNRSSDEQNPPQDKGK